MMTAPRQPLLRGELRVGEPLRRYNTWRVGGPARRMYLPADVETLAKVLSIGRTEAIARGETGTTAGR